MLQLLLQLQLQAAVAPATCRARLGPVKGGKHVDDATFWHFKRLQRADAAERKGERGCRGGGVSSIRKSFSLVSLHKVKGSELSSLCRLID